MHLQREQLNAAVQQDILDADQADRLWAFLAERGQDTPALRINHILYYFGGALAMSAMTIFMNLGWSRFGGWGLVSIALAYAGAGLWLTDHFLHRKALPIPAGITGAFVVSMTPLAIFGLQSALGWWPTGRNYNDYYRLVDWPWIFMELGTLATGAIMLWRYRLPFMLMPVAVTLWYMSMDLTPVLFGPSYRNWEARQFVSLWFGLLTILLAFWVDLRSRPDRRFAFWLYLFGVIAFWGGLSLMKSDSELSKFFYLCTNLAMILIGTVLSRRIFVVCGALGSTGYIGHLAYSVFRNTMLFPLSLTAIGLLIIYLGILWQRHEHTISTRLSGLLPLPLRELLASGN